MTVSIAEAGAAAPAPGAESVQVAFISPGDVILIDGLPSYIARTSKGSGLLEPGSINIDYRGPSGTLRNIVLKDQDTVTRVSASGVTAPPGPAAGRGTPLGART